MVAAAATLWLVTAASPQALPGIPGNGATTPPATTGSRPAPTNEPTSPPHAPRTGGRREPATAAPSGPDRSTTPGTPTPPAQPPNDLLKRQQTPPPGVAEQVNVFLGGGGECLNEEQSGPTRIRGIDTALETPGLILLCFDNFDLTATLTVTLTPPTGHATTVVLPPPGRGATNTFHYYYRRLPYDPIGRYRVTAHQDRLNASAEFTVRPASKPRISVDLPSVVAAGADIHLDLGGFPPNQPTRLHLYDATGRYRTSFTVPADPHGHAHAVIDTRSDDPTGCYAISSPLADDPHVPIETIFCILPNASP